MSDEKLLTPEDLAHKIYAEALAEVGGDVREASVVVLQFLVQAIVYSVGMSTGGDEALLTEVLGHVGDQIRNAPVQPLVAMAIANKKEKRP